MNITIETLRLTKVHVRQAFRVTIGWIVDISNMVPFLATFPFS